MKLLDTLFGTAIDTAEALLKRYNPGCRVIVVTVLWLVLTVEYRAGRFITAFGRRDPGDITLEELREAVERPN